MDNENIKVYLRIRPGYTNNEELQVQNDSVIVQNTKFSFDKIFLSATQQDIYANIANKFVVESMQGFNSVIFAYGQTGSGKTHTIQGNMIDRGLIPRTLGYLYNMNVIVKISFLEIYNEQMIDLFRVENQINLREDPFRGVYAENLTEINSINYEESMKLYSLALRNRKTASTSMNRHSSRSHSIFTITIQRNNVKKSQIIFVDLAGSEKLKSTSQLSKTETCNINKSLLCLGEVIKKLSKKEDHINYRDSKLTFLLREALAGNSKLAVIGTIHSSTKHIKETLNTLKFINRVKNIKNNPIQNTSLSENIEELKNRILELDKENQTLKMQIYLSKNKENTAVASNYTPVNIYRSMICKCSHLLNEIKTNFFDLKESFSIFLKEKSDTKMELLKEIAENQRILIKKSEMQVENLEFENFN